MYAPGWVKLFQRRATELQRCPPSTDREQALMNLDAGVSQEREQIVWRICAVEFRWRRDGQGLTELTQVG